jgi:hypothetical protein
LSADFRLLGTEAIWGASGDWVSRERPSGIEAAPSWETDRLGFAERSVVLWTGWPIAQYAGSFGQMPNTPAVVGELLSSARTYRRPSDPEAAGGQKRPPSNAASAS